LEAHLAELDILCPELLLNLTQSYTPYKPVACDSCISSQVAKQQQTVSCNAKFMVSFYTLTSENLPEGPTFLATVPIGLIGFKLGSDSDKVSAPSSVLCFLIYSFFRHHFPLAVDQCNTQLFTTDMFYARLQL